MSEATPSEFNRALTELDRLRSEAGEFQIDPGLIQELTSINQETDRVKKAERMVTLMQRAVEIAQTSQGEVAEALTQAKSAAATSGAATKPDFEEQAATKAALDQELREAEEAVNREKARLGGGGDQTSTGTPKSARSRMRV